MMVLGFFLVGAALLVLIPALVLFAECVAAAFALPKKGSLDRPKGVAVAVLIPAHDEAGQIQETVANIKHQLECSDRLIVIADNCSDGTAQLAESRGAQVVQRDDPSRRGKGFALNFGFQYLSEAPPDVVVVVDADCLLRPGAISNLVSYALTMNRPVQSDYVLASPSTSTISLVSTLAMLIRNRVRPQGLQRLGLPCHLMGTGMALPWHVIGDVPALGAELTEDLVLGVELALRGHPPVFCSESRVVGWLPNTAGAAMKQRRRWEHGHMSTLLRHCPRLIFAGIAQRRMDLAAIAVDLMVPPLALLVTLQTVLFGTSVVFYILSGAGSALALSAFGLIVTGLAIGLAWFCFGRRSIPFRALAAAPAYIIWKLPIYFSFLIGQRERKWRRTDRG